MGDSFRKLASSPPPIQAFGGRLQRGPSGARSRDTGFPPRFRGNDDIRDPGVTHFGNAT
jgi:hypothetical protein